MQIILIIFEIKFSDFRNFISGDGKIAGQTIIMRILSHCL